MIERPHSVLHTSTAAAAASDHISKSLKAAYNTRFFCLARMGPLRRNGIPIVEVLLAQSREL